MNDEADPDQPGFFQQTHKTVASNWDESV
ncbi:hypothetical protein GP2143_11509 [marine gamma proteobacterium HTCC2143]|uniref:Uncharacterized protein n=1 Tax=marine gamma proteobacterium HTCC2143 TaxID=247633 RepID=A0YHF0_9GAMM|nr:hypothetical protein GP2143_11509 [marine gamma proteobacterium HTCC2143]